MARRTPAQARFRPYRGHAGDTRPTPRWRPPGPARLPPPSSAAHHRYPVARPVPRGATQTPIPSECRDEVVAPESRVDRKAAAGATGRVDRIVARHAKVRMTSLMTSLQ